MRVFGILLIIVGILMIVFNSINFKTKKKVVDVGPLQVNKEENHHVGWPVYVGAIVLVGGIGTVIVSGGKKGKE